MRWILSIAAALTTATLACSASYPFGACPEGLGFLQNPVDTTVSVGQQFTPSLQVSTCGSGGFHPYTDLAWSVEDTTVLRVDSPSGRVTAINSGRTRLVANTKDYGKVQAGGYVTVR